MSAEHGGQHGILALLAEADPVVVLLDGLEALLLAVPVADLVAQAGPDAEAAGAGGDLKQGAGDLGVGGVVVEDGGDALLDAVDQQRVGAGPAALQGQLAVHGPPGAVQHLVEIGGIVAHDGQAAGQGGVDVGVGVDEGGHDDAAPGVDDLGVGVFEAQGGLLAHLGDGGAVKGHGAVLVVAPAPGVPGDQAAVGDKIHTNPSCE